MAELLCQNVHQIKIYLPPGLEEEVMFSIASMFLCVCVRRSPLRAEPFDIRT